MKSCVPLWKHRDSHTNVFVHVIDWLQCDLVCDGSAPALLNRDKIFLMHSDNTPALPNQVRIHTLFEFTSSSFFCNFWMLPKGNTGFHRSGILNSIPKWIKFCLCCLQTSLNQADINSEVIPTRSDYSCFAAPCSK